MGNFVFAQKADTLLSVDLEGVTVLEGKTYKIGNTNLVTRLDVPVLDLPQSIQSIPLKILKDQQVFSVVEAGKNINGLNFPTQITGEFVLRGFAIDYQNALLINGMRAQTGSGYTTLPVYNVASLDAVKGPASALFSIAEPGGVLNLQTLKPQESRNFSLELTYGSWDLFRLTGDATGALTKDKKLLYRMVVGGSSSNSFRDFQKFSDLFLAPSLTYRFSDKSSLNLEYNIVSEKYTYPFDYGTYVTAHSDGKPDFDHDVPLSFSGSNPNDKGSAASQMIYANFEHHFSSKVKVNVLANYNNRDTDAAQHLTGFGFFNATQDTIFGRAYIDFDTKSYNSNLNFYGTFLFNTGQHIRHNLVAGLDLGRYGISDNTYSFNYGNVLPIYVNNPNYDLDKPETYIFDDPTFGITETYSENRTVIGGYIQDMIDLGKVKALIGLRYDDYFSKNSSLPNYLTEAARDTSEADALLPRIGLVYQPLSFLSIYGSYTTSFRPQTSNSIVSGGPFDPQKGVQYEFGAKADLIQNRLLATIAWFSIDKNNLLIPDVKDPLGIRQVQVNAVNSKGVELSVQGSITSALSLIANYSYTDARFTEDAQNNQKGDRLINSPKHIFSAWANYDLKINDDSKLVVGAGARHFSDAVTAFSANPQTFLVPSYTVLDASLGYFYQKVGLRFNLNNLTDARYFTGAYGFVSVFPGAPRNFRATLSYDF